MIVLEGVSKAFPDKNLFRNVSLTIKEKMRIGLVGPNGSGKTTLLNLIMERESPDSGTVTKPARISIGHLEQEVARGLDSSILETVLSSLPEVQELEAAIHTLSEKLKKSPGNKTLIRELGTVQEQFEKTGGWEIETQARQYLGGLGIPEKDFHRSLKEYSGGWRMRVKLARLLIQKPDCLFLDEPTNHLDLEAVIWLETFLQSWQGGLLLISHDREFLNRSVTHIMDIDGGKIDLYHGNYTFYKAEKEKRLVIQKSAYRNQQKKIAQTERFIERFRYKNTKSKQVQSRIRQLEKQERIESPEVHEQRFGLRIPQPSRGPLKVIQARGVEKSYADLQVYGNLNLVIERGQKIGLVGVNGSGKSTLLKMLAGVEPVSKGSVVLAQNVNRSYFAQHQLEALDPDKTVYETIQEQAPQWTVTEVRGYLGGFLFSGDAVEKKVLILSGGERSRLALAKMLTDPAHFLLFDEPTNHLDIQARDIVEEALKNYSGTLVCISHDRHFLNTVTNMTIEIRAGDIKVYDGNYDYYLWKKHEETEQLQPAESREPDPAPDRSENQLLYKERKRLKNRLGKLEKESGLLEKRLSKIQEEIQNPPDPSDFAALSEMIDRHQHMEDSYLELLQEIEDIRKALDDQS